MRILFDTRSRTHRDSIRSVLLLTFILLLFGPHAFPQAEKVRLQRIDITEHPLIHLYLTVTDESGNSVLGLTEKELRVSVDETDQNILSIQSAFEGNETLAVALLFDRSGSMREAMDEAKTAALDFVNRLSVSDELAVVSFDDQVNIDSEFTKDRNMTRDAIKNIRLGRDTAMYDAVNTALDLLDTVPNKRRAVIVLSDGKDNRSLADKEMVLQTAKDKSIPLYTINLGTEADTETLLNLSQITGGHFFNAAAPGDLLALYQKIADQLNNQYRITFQSSFGMDEHFHKLRVIYQDPEGTKAEEEKDYIASKGPGIPRETVADFERQFEKQNILFGLAIGSLLGLVLGLLVLLLLKAIRPEVNIVSPKGIGLLLSALLLGAVMGVLYVFWR